MKLLRFISLAAFFAVLVWASLALPARGDSAAPAMALYGAADAPSPGSYFTINAYKQTGTVNIVTAVLADYRGFDTLGETLVVFVAGMAVALIIGKREDNS